MRLKIKDFQIIKDADIEFSSGFNCIIGSNGEGKSSIFRAIDAVVANSSEQNDINHNAKGFEITLENNNNSLTLIREKGNITYIDNLKNGNNGKDGIYEKAGKIDSRSICNTGFCFNDNKVMNILTDDDKLFPFGYTDTEVFKLFEDIFFDASDTSTVIESMKADENSCTKEIVELKKQKQLNEDKINNIEEITKKYNVNDIYELSNSIKKYYDTLKLVNSSLIEYEKYDKFKNIPSFEKVDFDFSIVDEYYKVNELLDKYDNFHKISQIELQKQPELNFNIVDDYYNVQNALNNYDNLQQQNIQCDNQLNIINNREKQLREQLANIKNCPLCNSPL